MLQSMFPKYRLHHDDSRPIVADDERAKYWMGLSGSGSSRTDYQLIGGEENLTYQLFGTIVDQLNSKMISNSG